MDVKNTIWTLKYAPDSLESMILPNHERAYFSSLTTIPKNMLFLGEPGCGKTTMANILINKFAPNSYLRINASMDNGIDVIRQEISGFVSTVSFDGGIKVIHLAEADNLSKAAQDALREIMEENLDTVRFILTGNYPQKLIDAIHSRCERHDFRIDYTSAIKRIVYIIKSENIKVDPENKEHFIALINKYLPDFRKVLNELQKACSTGTFIPVINNDSSIAKEIYTKIKNKENVFDIREHVIKNEQSFNGDYHSVMRNLFDLYVIDKNKDALLFIADHMFKDLTVLDKEINFSALLFNLTNI